MENYSEGEAGNVGYGKNLMISGLAKLVKKAVCHEGKIFFNTEKPDGTPRKLIDCLRLNTLG